jgi:hypothetical protein
MIKPLLPVLCGSDIARSSPRGRTTTIAGSPRHQAAGASLPPLVARVASLI